MGGGEGLVEGGREAFVELGFEAFAGTDYGDVRDLREREGEGGGGGGGGGVEAEAVVSRFVLAYIIDG